MLMMNESTGMMRCHLVNVVVEGGTGIGSYTTNLTGLTSGSTIYFRGYAVNSSGTGYTCQDSYDTP